MRLCKTTQVSFAAKFIAVSAVLCIGLICETSSGQEAKPAAKVTFDDHVKHVLVQRCSSCHSSSRKEADLDVTNYTALMMGGGSGEVISPGVAGDSYLYSLITHEDSPEMPPSGTKIPANEIKMIADWINQGALENAGSKPLKAKPKMDMAVGESATKRPEVIPVPIRMPLEPVIKTARPATTAIATSPWAPLAAIAAPKQVFLYNTTTLELNGVLPMEEGIAHTLRFSRNGSLLLAGGGRDGQLGTTVLWNVQTGERVTTIGEELDSVLAADISPTHEYVAIGGPSKLIKILSTADGEVTFEIKKHTDWVTALEFSPDGKYLATGDRNGGLHVWEVESGAELFTLKGHTKSITGVSWRTDSKILASCSEDSTTKTWEMKKGKQVKTWGAHGQGTTSIEFLRDGNIVTCGRDQVAKTWDQNGKLIKQFGGLSDVSVAVSYCDETNRVIAADWRGQIRVWNAADAVHVGNLAANPPTIAERISTAEKAFVAATQKHAPLAAKAHQVKTQLDQLAATLAATKQSKAEMTTKVAQTESRLNAAKKQFASTKTQHEQWRKELEAKNAAKPLIQKTFATASEAAKALPEDSELKQTVVQLDCKKKTIDARVAELNGLVAKANQEKNTTRTQMDQLAVALKGEREQVAKLTTEVTQLESQVQVVTKNFQSETAAAQAAKAELDRGKQQVDKWKGHLAFIGQLNALKTQLGAATKEVEAKQVVVHDANKKLSEAQKVVDAAKQAKQEKENAAKAIQDEIKKLRGGQ